MDLIRQCLDVDGLRLAILASLVLFIMVAMGFAFDPYYIPTQMRFSTSVAFCPLLAMTDESRDPSDPMGDPERRLVHYLSPLTARLLRLLGSRGHSYYQRNHLEGRFGT